MEILHYPLIQFHVHLVIQNELFNWLPLETNMICSSTIHVQVTCSLSRFVLLQKSCTWRGSSTSEILAAEISYIHCNPIQTTKPQFRIFFPQYAVTPTSRDLERNTYLMHAHARRLIKVKQKVTELQSWTKVCLNLYLFFSSGNNWPIDMAAWLCEWELWELPWDTHDACKITQENDHIFKMGIEETIGHNQASTKRILFLCTQKQPQWKKP